MEKRRKVSNPLALAAMAWLVRGPMHPYELGRRLQETGMDRSIKYNRGSLYMVVEQLRKAGFVAEQETVREGQRPERTVYALTEQGRAELYDWMRELVTEPRHEYPYFGVALSLLSVLEPGEAAELLGRRLETLTAEVEETRASMQALLDGGLLWIFQIEEEYRLTVLEAEQRFVAKLIDSLRRPGHAEAWHELFRSDT
ncbi:PadR family transcriptional regulator [Sphaerisporangium siamense]|uniref:DNA-binding PadR family transcriptional regulator n=1 Tax=Sphaerisporangium siamense TaxID=795645 RepID=A0A7W7DB65_9ACTN|nr:PadR family transcriptional regulator [Sphaerisporangium siamense]MBB4703396.1 DNA-binding PadR family transcriptional regulator [Sphaerisporangium siamense]GII87609.1 PadR family transcriptional regulator [Sphaerisporangium siamense]